MLIAGGEIGQIVKNGKVTERQYQKVDTDSLIYCWRHPITLTSDWKNPSPEDQKKLDKIRLVEGETKNKDGTWTKFRWCRKCGNTVYYTKPK